MAGRVAIVTGAGQGMGRAVAQKLASDGARIVVNDVNAEAADRTVAQLTEAGGEATAITGDVTSSSDVEQLRMRLRDLQHTGAPNRGRGAQGPGDRAGASGAARQAMGEHRLFPWTHDRARVRHHPRHASHRTHHGPGRAEERGDSKVHE